MSNDGGPAFPNHPSMTNYANPGMSLLDYFAGQALAGITARGCFTTHGVAESAYQYAEAMLAFRQKQQKVSESQQVALGIGGEK